MKDHCQSAGLKVAWRCNSEKPISGSKLNLLLPFQKLSQGKNRHPKPSDTKAPVKGHTLS